MKKYYTLLVCGISILFHAQIMPTAVPQPVGSHVFLYDDAGNQIFRGYVCDSCPAPVAKGATEADKGNMYHGDWAESFWSEIGIYPVPVKDLLTISWTDQVDALIDEVSLYEQNTVHWKFQQKNFPSIDKQIQIDMSHYYMGVYVLTFQLRDGRVVSKNITKF